MGSIPTLITSAESFFASVISSQVLEIRACTLGEVSFCLLHSVIWLPTTLPKILSQRSPISSFLRNTCVLVDLSAALNAGTSHRSGLSDHVFSQVSFLLHNSRLAFPVSLANDSVSNRKC